MPNPSNRLLQALVLVAVIAAGGVAPSAVRGDSQLAQVASDGEAARIARDIELGEEKARQDEKQDARDARERTQEELRLKGEIERDTRAGEAAQRRSQRRSRFRAILE